MTVSTPQFWQLLTQSRIVSPTAAAQWQQEFGAQGAPKPAGAARIAEWLIQRNRITPYHARVLLAGHPGPFLFGDYCILDRIVDPRLADRFQALHRPTKFRVWLQFASPGGGSGPDSTAAICEQGTRHCRVAAPSLSDCYELAREGDRIWLAEEAIQGRRLDAILTKHSPLTVEQVAQIGYHVAVALAALHRAQLLHSDLRLGDIWITQSRCVKLLRHPLRIIGSMERDASGSQEVPRSRDRARYTAPELSLSGRAPTRECDLYALGVVLFRMLSGRFPFEGRDVATVLQQQLNQPPMPLASDLPQPLRDLVASLLSKQPSARGPAAVDVATTLGALIGGAARTSEVTRDARRERYLALLPPSDEHRAVEPRDVVTDAAAASIDPDRAADHLKPRRRTLRNAQVAATVAAVFALVAVGGWAIHRAGSSRKSRTAQDDAAGVRVSETADVDTSVPLAAVKRSLQDQDPGVATTEQGAHANIVPDDGRLLWASPTHGGPLTLKYVPTSAKFYGCVRPAEFLAHEEGKRVLRALGPRFQQHVARWEQRTGFRLSEVERLTLAWAPNQGKMPILVSVIWTADPVEMPRPVTDSHQGKGYVVTDDLATYQPSEQAGRVTVVGALALVKEVIEQGEAAPILRREIGLLRQVSDETRQLNILFPPNFLFYDGRPLFGSRAGRLLDPLDDLLGDGIHAGLLSFHLGSRYDFYGELRLVGRSDIEPAEITAQLRHRLDRVPMDVENFVSGQHTEDYWRLVAGRFDKMLIYLRDRLRYGTQRDQTVVNFVAPAPAAHNLFLASELSLATSTPATSAEPDRRPPDARTVSQLLEQRTTLEFTQRSLEASLEELESQVREAFGGLPSAFRIEVLGGDLQMEGITRNQQVKNFRQADKTVAEILTAIVMTANPVTTVKSPSETDQKLVWCVIADPQRPAQEVVVVTTRKAASERGYDLPPEFRQK